MESREQKENGKNQTTVSEDEEANYETAILAAGFGKHSILVLIMLVFATWSTGFDAAGASTVMPAAACELELTSLQIGWLNSAAYIGMLTSSHIWGFLSDTYGRRKLLIWGYTLNCLCVMASSLAPNFLFMFILKIISGALICGPFSIRVAYISEVFSYKMRDIAILLLGIYLAIGNMVQAGMALLLIPEKFHWSLFGLMEMYPWRVYLFLCSFPSLMAAYMVRFCEESPKFLLDKGRHREALESLSRIYSKNTGSSRDLYPIKHLKSTEKKDLSTDVDKIITTNNSKIGRIFMAMFKQISELLHPPYLPKILFAFFTMAGNASVANGLRLTLPEMFSHMEDSSLNATDSELACTILMMPKKKNIDCSEVFIDRNVYINMLKIFAFALICQCIFNVSARFVKRSLIIFVTVCIPSICALLIPSLTSEYVVYASAILVSLMNINFLALLSVVVIMFPTRLRATSVSLCMLVARCGILFGNLFVARQIYSNCYFAFYFSGAILIAVSLFSLLLPKPDKQERDTENQSLPTMKSVGNNQPQGKV